MIRRCLKDGLMGVVGALLLGIYFLFCIKLMALLFLILFQLLTFGDLGWITDWGFWKFVWLQP